MTTTETSAGPWVVGTQSRPGLLPHFVCRQISESQWEQLQRDDGCGISRFETMTDAQAAADEANRAGDQP